MANSKVYIKGKNQKDRLESLFNQCSNNNQICYHLKKNPDLVQFLKKETKLNLDIITLLYHYKENIKKIPKCLCGENRKYHCWSYRPTCGNKNCIKIERENSKRKSCLKKYGVEYVTQLDSMKNKSKKTHLEKYGVDNITKLPEVIKKRKENNLKKWGVTDPISLKKVRGRIKSDSETIQDGLPDGYKILESDKSYYYKVSCPEGHIFEIGKSVLYIRKKDNLEICNECNTSIGSNGEQELYEYISSIYNGYISRSNRKLISPYEIDIVLEDIKVCIEFNGDYWHSINVNDDRFYHLNKMIKCRDIGYDLLQVKENDWNKNKEEIKRKLFNRINNIYDKNDLNIDGDYLIFDLSWYDSRILEDLENIQHENIEPKLIESGKYKQWNCGYKLFKIF